MTRWLLAGTLVWGLAGCGGCTGSDPGTGGGDDDDTGSVGGQDGSYVANPDGGGLEDGGGNTPDGSTVVGGDAGSHPDGGTVNPQDGGTVVTGDGGTVTPEDGGTVVTGDGGTVTPEDGGTVVTGDGGTVTPEDGGTVVTGDGGTVTPDAGGEPADAGPAPDAAPPVNHDPVISSVDAEQNPFVGATLVTVHVSDPDGDPVQCDVTATAAGVSVTPAGVGADPSCTVSVAESAPRQTLVLQVSAQDGRGGSDQTTYELTIGNHAPTASAGPAASVLPGDSAALSVVAADADTAAPGNDTLNFQWTQVGPAIPGVNLTGADSAAPQVSVDRAVYAGGPKAQTLAFSVTVKDDQGQSALASVDLVIGDERGPYVANTSSYAGTGPQGYCGALAHPCSNIPDALANLRSAVDEGMNVPAEVHVATTGTDYALMTELTLDKGVSLVCGFDRGTWDRTAARTPLRFLGSRGVVLRSAVTLQGCDIEGVPGMSPVIQALRVAVAVESGGSVVTDNRVVGNGTAGNATNAYGMTVALSVNPNAAVRVEGNVQVEGGVALTGAVGISSQGAPVSISNNTIRGGQAKGAVGMYVSGPAGPALNAEAAVTGNTISGGEGTPTAADSLAVALQVDEGSVRVAANPAITGGVAQALAVGLLVSRKATNPVVTGNTILGSTGAVTDLAAGAIFNASGAASGNTITGGQGDVVVGVAVDGDPDNAGAALPVSVTVEGGSITGGSATASVVGVSGEDSATLALTGVEVQGGTGTSPTYSHGIALTRNSGLSVTNGSVRSGNAVSAARGIYADAKSTTVTLRGVQVSAGDANATVVPFSSSEGVALEGGLLNVQSSPRGSTTITAGRARTRSMGVNLSCPFPASAAQPHVIQQASITAGNAGDSYGVVASNCGYLTTSGNTLVAGTASSMISVGLDALGTVLTASGDSLQAAAAPLLSLGLRFEGDGLNATNLVSSSGTAGMAGMASGVRSAGMYLRDASNSTVQGGSATAGDALGSVESQSGGIIVELVNDAQLASLKIAGVTATGSTSTGSSAGLGVLGNTAGLSVSGGTFTGGTAPDSYGMVVADPGSGTPPQHTAMQVEQGQFTAGTCRGAAGYVSAGVWLGGDCVGCVVSRNFIKAAAAEQNGARSVGLRYFATNPPARPSFIVNNDIRAGASNLAHGLEMDGNAGDAVRVLHNNIHAGGRSGGTSAAVFMGNVMTQTGINLAGQYGGNILDRGTGSLSVGFWENCTASGGMLGVQWSQPARAANTDFWPAVTGLPTPTSAAAYVVDSYFALPNNCSDPSANAWLTIAQVNNSGMLSPYAQVNNTNKSWDVDPLFQGDGYHLSDTSPLVQKAPAAVNLWGAVLPYVDVDGEVRPNGGTAPDIGMDETPR